ncbi:hypothetical protein ACJRO7_014785 [Eucalyptus globulus]|uniref:NB-ARC domain-containing protein n=1 Tax=Eucalyptus globulus TaxID=34317 RepID=A0ABD3L230_EUCGL
MKDRKAPYATDIEAHKANGVAQATIEEWEGALKEVASLKGRQVDRGQGEFVKMMVSKVLKRLRKAKLNLSDKLVGIEDCLTELRSMLDTDSNDVRMIVISGIPGIGKTTLAKSLYNDICDLFDGCSFLGDIEETSAKKGLEALQTKLVSDITQRNLGAFDSVEDGVSACNCESLAQVSSEIGDIRSLEFLTMDGSELSVLPDSIKKLEKLKQLSLRDCQLMWKIPGTIGRLTSLENLDLSFTAIDELPHAIGYMQKLKVLKMERSFIRGFPPSIGTLVNLEEIHASCCWILETIPKEIKGLSRLRILVLSRTNIRSLPESISSLPHLRNLDLSGCNNLHGVPPLPSNLAALRLTYDSSKMKSLDISNLTNLKELYLANYLEEEEASSGTDLDVMAEPITLSGIGNVTKVETLKLCLTGFTTLPEEMGALSQLRKLDLQCPYLQRLPKLPKSLKKLTLQDCKSLEALPDLKDLKSLSGLELFSCAVTEIQGLGSLSSLETLLISHCKLEKLDGVECLPFLRVLTISYCNSLQGLPDLSNLEQLRECKIQHCKNIPQQDSRY